MIERLETRAPVGRKVRTDFCRLIDLDGRGKTGAVGFTETVHWLREAGARGVFMHGGKEISCISGFGDHTYGYLYSLRPALEESQQAAKRFSVDRTSTLTVEVTGKIVEHPMLADTDRVPEYKGFSCYVPVPKDWLLLKDGEDIQSTTIDRWDLDRRLEPVTILERVIWSSANDDETNAALLDAFRRDAKAGLGAEYL